MACDPADFIQMRILYFGFWEPNISAAIEAILRPGDVFVDVGANVGYETLLGAHLVGNYGRVVAIEASPSTCEILERNLRENRTSNVRLVAAAVSDDPGEILLYEGSPINRGTATTVQSANTTGRESHTVPCLPLDQILTPDEIARVRLIKMDIEGAELPVLRRLLTTLELYPPDMRLIVEATPRVGPTRWAQTLSLFREAGFRAYAILHNESVAAYLDWRSAAPLEEVFELPPDRQVDLLLTRQGLTPDNLVVD
jgi:FkbM family methyltransferase